MVKSIDLSQTDLRQALVGDLLLYKDRREAFYIDNRKGLFGRFSRAVMQAVGARNYRLEELLSIAITQPLTPVLLQNIGFLKMKIAKEYGISGETYRALLSAEKVLGGSELKEFSSDVRSKDVEEVAKLLKTLCKDKKLQRSVRSYTQKLPNNEKQVTAQVIERLGVTKKWVALGLDPVHCVTDYSSVAFLVQSHLIYKIVGFQYATSGGALRHAICVDDSGHLLIKKESQYVSVRKLQEDFWINYGWDDIVERATGKNWNYLSPDGLIAVNRFTNDLFLPVEQLSQQEMSMLVTHAQSMFPEEKDGVNRNAVLQIVSDPRVITGGNSFLLTRLEASLPVHAAVRLISPDGKVYSTGLGWDPLEHRDKRHLSSVSGIPTILDYKEFRRHDGRIVTSIPITSENCNELLREIEQYRTLKIRYNVVRQNCVKLVEVLLDKTGVKVTTCANFSEIAKNALPSTPKAPFFRQLPRKIGIKTELMPDSVRSQLKRIKKMALFMPRMGSTISINMLFLVLGAGSGSSTQAGALESFHSLIDSPKQLFSADAFYANTSLKLMQWQLQQSSTLVYPYEGRPSMGLLPHPLTEEAKKLREKFEKKLLFSFNLHSQQKRFK